MAALAIGSRESIKASLDHVSSLSCYSHAELLTIPGQAWPSNTSCLCSLCSLFEECYKQLMITSSLKPLLIHTHFKVEPDTSFSRLHGTLSAHFSQNCTTFLHLMFCMPALSWITRISKAGSGSYWSYCISTKKPMIFA